MPDNPSQPTPKEIYYAADQYLPYLSEPLQSQIQALLEEAQAGKKRDTIILSLISDDKAARQWMRMALFGKQFETLQRGYEPLAGGGPTSVPANSRWKCPECDFEWRVLRKGRPVPNCPEHNVALVHIKA
jgi:hypothetical protein